MSRANTPKPKSFCADDGFEYDGGGPGAWTGEGLGTWEPNSCSYDTASAAAIQSFFSTAEVLLWGDSITEKLFLALHHNKNARVHLIKLNRDQMSNGQGLGVLFEHPYHLNSTLGPKWRDLLETAAAMAGVATIRS